VNAEWAGARWIASTGGLSDFARGARAADGGRSIIAIQATGPSGESRIKARLTCPTITLARADADIFVTEYGMAMVKNLDVEARARAIIAIAAPNHRESLAAEWAAA
jgi:acyl-CoA hydrolase